MNRQNITLALFDIRPVDPQTGLVDFDSLNNLRPELDLSNLKDSRPLLPDEQDDFSQSAVSIKSTLEGEPKEKKETLQELEATLSQNLDLKKELKVFGGALIEKAVQLRPRRFPDHEEKSLEDFRKEFSKLTSSEYEPVLASTGSKFLNPPSYLPWGKTGTATLTKELVNLSPAAKELDSILESFKKEKLSPNLTVLRPLLEPPLSQDKTSKLLLFFSFGIIAVFVFTFLAVKSLNLKRVVLERSNLAFLNLNQAKENLLELNFFEAASSFALAAKNFELIQNDFGKFKAVLTILNGVTLGKVSDASNLVKAGELISQSGQDLSQALVKLSDVNLISAIQGNNEKENILNIIREFKLLLIQASRNLNQAQDLIYAVDADSIPEEHRGKFLELRDKLPEFNKFIEKSIDYSDILLAILGETSPQKYLILFQNSSELRPSGGFPGSYALARFNKGIMEEFAVDDIYNPDGQLKEKIIPPRPLQKITPNWGMRDANWFSDFPSSAKKVAEFYYKDTGILVDGVWAFNVDLVPEVLKITGPIEMPDYNVILNSENFLAEIQEEVEYLKTKGTSKQILVDFAPKLLERLGGLEKSGWLDIFALFVEGAEEKNILAYFADSRLQRFALENDFAGEIKDIEGDYLMVVHSNVMGAKTDAVMDNSISLNIETDSENNLIHNLEITRTHNGGNTGLGFYDRKNNDYVRVLVQESAEFLGIEGNDNFVIEPLLDYKSQKFSADPDLARYESKIKRVGNVEIFEEGGKTVFAFWLIIEPGKTKMVKIRYKTSAALKDYKLYIQKQPGAKQRIQVKIENKTILDGLLEKDIYLGD